MNKSSSTVIMVSFLNSSFLKILLGNAQAVIVHYHLTELLNILKIAKQLCSYFYGVCLVLSDLDLLMLSCC